MSRKAIVIHGGALDDSAFIRQNIEDYQAALAQAAETGFLLLEQGKSAKDAVEAAIRFMEDHELFNAGRGSALNVMGGVHMDASMMDGKDLSCGGVAVLSYARNPISVARLVMEETKNVLLAGEGALQFARSRKVELRDEDYFITDHQREIFREKCGTLSEKEIDELRNHGTVGAVAMDENGNIAAGTSTGGAVFNRIGRVGDSPIIGAGCFADNNTCGVSGTGDGEYLIRSTAAGYVSMLMEHTGLSIQEALDHVIHVKNKGIEGDMGLVAIDKHGNIGMSFNTQAMHRAWISTGHALQVRVYKETGDL